MHDKHPMGMTNDNRKLAALVHCAMLRDGGMPTPLAPEVLSMLERWNGARIWKSDESALLAFPGASDAVGYSLLVQTMQPDNVMRMGIHLGDVAKTNDAAYGSGVDITEHLCSHALPGGTCISRAIYDLAQPIYDATVHPLGELKTGEDNQTTECFLLVPGGKELDEPAPRPLSKPVPHPEISSTPDALPEEKPKIVTDPVKPTIRRKQAPQKTDSPANRPSQSGSGSPVSKPRQATPSRIPFKNDKDKPTAEQRQTLSLRYNVPQNTIAQITRTEADLLLSKLAQKSHNAYIRRTVRQSLPVLAGIMLMAFLIYLGIKENKRLLETRPEENIDSELQNESPAAPAEGISLDPFSDPRYTVVRDTPLSLTVVERFAEPAPDGSDGRFILIIKHVNDGSIVRYNVPQKVFISLNPGQTIRVTPDEISDWQTLPE